ncbi:MAG: DinB family protein [Planctomycetota bacterium]|jgi:hypothetical protein
MDEPHPINRTLLTLLDNQIRRMHAALDDLPPDAIDAAPGGDCNSIRGIMAHLVNLRWFQLTLLESPLASSVHRLEPGDEQALTPEDLRTRLLDATELLREAVGTHDPDDWYRVPEHPREGLWGDLPTIVRLMRPLNDFTNHLGGIRAIRRIAGCPAERTQ